MNGEAISGLTAATMDVASDFFRNSRLFIQFSISGAKLGRNRVNQKLKAKQNMFETKLLFIFAVTKQ